MKNINILLNIKLVFAVFLLTQSCSDKSVNYSEADIDCTRCYEEFPYYFELELQFTIDARFKEVYYKIYNGYAEAAPVVYEGVSSKAFEYIYMDSEQLYSVVAEYYDPWNDRLIYVVNEFFPKPVLYKNACSEECYYIAEDYVNMRINNYDRLYFP